MSNKSLNRKALIDSKNSSKEFNNQIKSNQEWILLQNKYFSKKKGLVGKINDFSFNVDNSIEKYNRDYERNHINKYSSFYDLTK